MECKLGILVLKVPIQKFPVSKIVPKSQIKMQFEALIKQFGVLKFKAPLT